MQKLLIFFLSKIFLGKIFYQTNLNSSSLTQLRKDFIQNPYYECECDLIIGLCENCNCDLDCLNPQTKIQENTIEQVLPYSFCDQNMQIQYQKDFYFSQTTGKQIREFPQNYLCFKKTNFMKDFYIYETKDFKI